MSQRVLTHSVDSTVVKMQMVENANKKGLRYFLTGTISDTTQTVIKDILTLYGGKAFWLLTPSVKVKAGNTHIEVNLSDIHLLGGRYAWQSLPDTLPAAGKKVIWQIADWVQYTASNGYDTPAGIVIVHTPSVYQGLDMITNNNNLQNFAHMAGIEVAEIADPTPYRTMTQIMVYNKTPRALHFINRFYGVGLQQKRPWQYLKTGSVIDLVAPSSAYPENYVRTAEDILQQRGFIVRTKYIQQQKRLELYYSNSTEKRFAQLAHALNDPDSDAVWIMRGGGGATNLLPYLLTMPPPATPKPFIGFSDSTALHMFMNTQWNIPTLHGVVAQYNQQMTEKTGQVINKQANIDDVIDILTGKTTTVTYSHLQPLNAPAQSITKLHTRILGGNLTLATQLHGSIFYPQSRYQTPYSLLLEGIGNGLHQTERMLDSMAYSAELQNIDAVILGDFVTYDPRMDTQDYRNLLDTVVQRFADKVPIPVFRLKGVGHDAQNHPIPLNTKTTITAGHMGAFSLIVDGR